MVDLETKIRIRSDWDIRSFVLKGIKEEGGFVNAHAHIDRAFTVRPETLHLANATLQEKWLLVDEIKRESSVDQIYDRMALCVERMLEGGATALGTFIDVDEVIKDKAMIAGNRIRERYGRELKIIFINQVLKGVLNPSARKWFDMGAQFADIIGGLPGRDKGREEEHLDIILGTAKKLGKMVHVHVDQLNTSSETETELLVKKTVEHGMQGRVVGIHGISIAAHPKEYRYRLYRKMEDAGVMMISCPTAWIDSKRSEEYAPIHNAITPIEEMIPAGITVGLGTDNVADIYKPFTDGDMWTELHFLLECCRYYDIENLINIATKNGRQVLGL